MSKFNLLNPGYLLAISLLNFTLIGQEATKSDFKSDYSEALSYLFSLKPTGQCAKIRSEIIHKKDVGTIKLSEGELYSCNSYNGVEHALIFIGRGEFSFSPSTDIERKQLYRFYETENFILNFKEIFLLFDDNTYDEITSALTFENTSEKQAEDFLKVSLKYFKDNDDGGSRSDFVRSLMVESRNGFFYSQIQENKFNPVFFQINPFEQEAVSFMKGTYRGAENYRETINLFPAQQGTLINYSENRPNKYFLNLISYKIESTILDNLDFSAKCLIDFTSREQEQQWIMFYLFNEFIVDSIRWEDGSIAKFVNIKESGEVWIKCKGDFMDGDQHNLTLFYRGDLLDKNDLGWIYIKSSIYWYPRYDNRSKVHFGLIFHTPTKYDFVSVGDRISEIVREEVVTTTWLCNTPVRNVSFNIGNFDVYESKVENTPDVRVYISKFGHQQISSYFTQLGIHSMSDASEYIAHDISNSAKLFTEVFGNPAINSINITETPYLHGEAFPGLIHLSWATVVQTDFEGQDEIFRAHEVAHQWWGIGVDFDSYHDQWLSEGFAQYAGLWYLQATKNNNDLFFDILNDWKDKILNVRNYIIGSGQEAGPIWLGYRTSSSSTLGDYDLIIYKKGAWVLHMLRAMLLDLNTMNEDKIKKLFRDFFESYKNKNASTSDFIKIVNKYFSEDMNWFFDQFVYGTDIPLYKVAYKTNKTDDGKIKMTLRVRQEKVPVNFKMYVPVKIVLDGERVGRIRIEVKGKETFFTTPALEGEVEEIVFNDLESVLCEVNYEDWD